MNENRNEKLQKYGKYKKEREREIRRQIQT